MHVEYSTECFVCGERWSELWNIPSTGCIPAPAQANRVIVGNAVVDLCRDCGAATIAWLSKQRNSDAG